MQNNTKAMKMKSIFVISCLIILTTCSKEPIETESNDFEHTIQELFEYYKWLVSESKSYYDNGTGHFGQEMFGYRNVLNECYLRFDGYQMMHNTNFEENQWTKDVLEDIIKYYKNIADTIGTGVWGFPAEIKHPEFGDGFQYEINAGNSKNGWIYELSGDIGTKSGIYYVHGQVLSDISKTYLRNGNDSLLKYIKHGANWIVERDYNQGNVNYFASALKGLSYSYEITKDEEIKSKALAYLSSILNTQNENGSFGGVHDQEGGYHGITLSCIAVARKYLPENELPTKFDISLQKAMEYLRALEDVSVEDRAAFVVQAWYYLSCLADEGLIPKFTSSDWCFYSEAINICIQKKQELNRYKSENNYYYQKGIQTFSLVGNTVYKYYYDLKIEYY